MLKQKSAVYTLLGIFLIYFISVLFKSNFGGNILSPTVAFLSSFIILSALKKINNYRSCWIFLFFYSFIWGVADLFWFIYDNIFLIDPINVNFINVLYTLPNLFLVISVTLYYAYNFKKWNLFQLVLDMIAISAILIVVLWDFVFLRTTFQLYSNFEYINTIICIFFNFYILSGIIVAFVSTRKKKINKGYFIIIAGIIIVTIIDYYYAYLYLMKLYHPNTIIDGIYMISNVLFALGATYEAYYLSIKQTINKDELPENIRKPQKLTFVFILFYVLYLIGFFSFKMLIICVSISVLYWILTSQIQEGIRNKYLLKTELEINEHLEKIVQERTRELTIANKHLEEISNKDSLTGLYNRRYLYNYLDSLISDNMNKSFTLLYIDTNRFKSINDSYGHHIGDKVLYTLSNRFLKNGMPNCTAFRIGGDEFAVLIENYFDKVFINSVAERILGLIQTPISVYPYTFTVTASIGIVSYPEDAKDKDILMRYADIAMYEAKKTQRGNNYLFFDSELIKKIERKNEIEFFLKSANYDKEFVLYYQPQYSTINHSLIGMEALIRWKHPEKGFISPGEFIPIAEDIAAIVNIGEWVIDKAFNQIKRWNEIYCLNLKMSINVSPIQIENTNFINWFREKLHTENIDPNWIDLEITEGSAMNPNLTIEEVFDSFAHIGISTSIDDFGTGYSSLSYIKKFDVDRLKIAKELVDNIYEDKNALFIVQAIIMMAKGMGLKTIAEGVEDVHQLQILEKLECDEIQGYFFGKPVPVEEFEKEHINK